MNGFILGEGLGLVSGSFDFGAFVGSLLGDLSNNVIGIWICRGKGGWDSEDSWMWAIGFENMVRTLRMLRKIRVSGSLVWGGLGGLQ